MPDSVSPTAAPAEMPDPSSRWYTPGQAAALANVGPQTIYKAVRAKQLRAARIGGRREIRILGRWLQEWLESTDESTRATAMRVAR